MGQEGNGKKMKRGEEREGEKRGRQGRGGKGGRGDGKAGELREAWGDEAERLYPLCNAANAMCRYTVKHFGTNLFYAAPVIKEEGLLQFY